MSRNQNNGNPNNTNYDLDMREPIIPLDILYPLCGFLCCLFSLTCQSPECYGCYDKQTCCCIYHETICCKGTKEVGKNCMCFSQECMTGDCKVCRQAEHQCCCLDFRCSLPAIESQQPCICVMLGFVCYYENERVCYCCGDIKKVKSITERNEVRAAHIQQIFQEHVRDGPSISATMEDRRHNHSNNRSNNNSRRSLASNRPSITDLQPINPSIISTSNSQNNNTAVSTPNPPNSSTVVPTSLPITSNNDNSIPIVEAVICNDTTSNNPRHDIDEFYVVNR